MKNFIMKGKHLSFAAPSSINSGQLVVIGELVGVASTSAKQGEDISVSTQGVYEFDKPQGVDALVGDSAYLLPDGTVTSAQTDGNSLQYVGFFTEPASSTDTKARVKIG